MLSFPTWMVEIDVIPNPVWTLDTVTSNPFGWFLFCALNLFLCMHSLIISQLHSQGASSANLWVLSERLPPLQFSPVTSSHLCPSRLSLHIFYSGSPPSSAWVPVPGATAQKLKAVSLGICKAHLICFPFLSVHCPSSDVCLTYCKNRILCIFSILDVSGGRQFCFPLLDLG